MNVLLVSHRFPPRGTAGTENYTAGIARVLARHGHAVTVFAAAKDIARRHMSLERRAWEGIDVHEVFNNLLHEDFRETWRSPEAAACFAQVLDASRADVVHFQHLMYLSAGCLEVVRARGIPVLFTLHDYWLQCPRFGQRVHADGSVCHTIDFARCGTCLVSFAHAQTPAARTAARWIAEVRERSGIDLSRAVRRGAELLARRAAPSDAAVDPALARELEAAARERDRDLRAVTAASVDRFFAPSRFLRERFLREWSIPEERIEHLPLGVDLDAFAARPRQRNARVQVAFLGSLIPVKGAHVLLDAWGRLSGALRADADLVLYGPSEHHPEYQRELALRALAVGARLGGALERDEVARVLACTDLVVVPSVWYENSPLVILEATAARTPLLVSDQGGMAELVQVGVNGFHFRMGDAADLALALSRLLADRSALDALYQRPVAIPRVEEHVLVLEERYLRASAERAR
ncbi:MAG: glycosyltransferase [Planctomycetota bacterium]